MVAVGVRMRLTRGQEFFLMALLLCISGNPLFTQSETFLTRFLYPIAFFIVLVLFVQKIPAVAWKKCLIWTIILGSIFIGQYLVFHYITVLGSLNYLLKAILGILIAYIFGEKFPHAYMRVMVVICMISFPLFLLNAFGIYLPAITTTIGRESLIVYTQPSVDLVAGSQNGIPRNFGMFWEPGAFAGYINVAFILFIDKLEVLIKNRRKEVIILLIALLTTISTTGYVVLAIIVLFYFLHERRKGPGTILLAALAAGAMAFAFFRLDFMHDKIVAEYTVLKYQDWDTVNLSRFGSVLFDWQYIVLHPIVGNGLADITRFAMHIGLSDRLGGFGNGFTGAIHILGIPFMLIYMFTILKNKTLEHRWFALLIIILLLNGEYYLNYPLFFSLMYDNYGVKSDKLKLAK